MLIPLAYVLWTMTTSGNMSSMGLGGMGVNNTLVAEEEIDDFKENETTQQQ